ncbi:interleukin-1 receptor-like 2 [Sigmodon hispidus]
MWNCEPLHLDNVNFIGTKNKLLVRNVAEEHRGNYTCQVSYTYLGKQYPVTRVIAFITIGENKNDRPVIVSPRNETMEVDEGSPIQLICNVTGQFTDLVYWKWNGSEIDEIDDPLLTEDYQSMKHPSSKRKYILITILNITIVKSYFYQYPFTCFVKNTNVMESAHVKLIYPIPDFKNYIIGTFIILTTTIVWCVFIYKIFKVDIVLWYRDSCSDFLSPKASDGKTYDAYILYPRTFREGSSSNLDTFVFKLLPEVLEGQFGYKLFICGRDDCVGEDIIEVTNENVKKSRRLVIILMRNMGGFSWLGHSSEEQIAIYDALTREGIKIVLLELENIQDYEKMPESIQFIKQKHGVIRWSGDFKERPQSANTRFWKNLRYYMPAHRQSQLSRHHLLTLDPPPTAEGRKDGPCMDADMYDESISEGQPFAINCTFPPVTNGAVDLTWYKIPNQSPVSNNRQLRNHQDQTWLLFFPVEKRDSGIYQCVIRDAHNCYQIAVNLTVFNKRSCDPSTESLINSPNEYQQSLPVGKSGRLTCHLYFPDSCILDSIKWYKGCDEIKVGNQYAPLGIWLLMDNITAEDRGSYSCTARLTYLGREFTVRNYIAVSTKEVVSGVRIPNITYPKNNSIEVQLGSSLIVDCNITDMKDNTNRRCWTVNDTLVDDYYNDSKRIQEGIETNVSLKDHIFYTVNITFLEVKMEDYGHPFMCHAGISTAYIMLKLPAPDFRAYLIGGLMAFLLLVVSILCIYNSFKIDIVLWYRSAFHAVQAPDDEKLYDAYVLYPKCPRESQGHDVNTLVLKILPEVLENQCGYKLFIFGRDEFPGQAVANVIDENIQLCRRLIVLVAPESSSFGFLKSMSEEQIAVYNALIQHGMKVILIELEKIKDYSTMPESIQYIRQKHGAIQWNGDFTEQSQCAKTKFWKNVRYHMPPRRYQPSSPIQLLRHTPGTCSAGKWDAATGLITS